MSVPKLSLGTVDLSEDEIDWVKVACNMSGKSLRTFMMELVKGHLQRFIPLVYEERVQYYADKYGMTWEEAFKRLTEEEPPFGHVVEHAPVRRPKRRSSSIGLPEFVTSEEQTDDNDT